MLPLPPSASLPLISHRHHHDKQQTLQTVCRPPDQGYQSERESTDEPPEANTVQLTDAEREKKSRDRGREAGDSDTSDTSENERQTRTTRAGEESEEPRRNRDRDYVDAPSAKESGRRWGVEELPASDAVLLGDVGDLELESYLVSDQLSALLSAEEGRRVSVGPEVVRAEREAASGRVELACALETLKCACD